MKKRVLIVSHCMELGGIERSLVELLRAFDYDRFEVDLLLLAHTGPLLKELPPQVNLLPELPQLASFLQPIRQVIKRYPLLAAARVWSKLAVRRRFPCPPNVPDSVTFAMLQAYWRTSLPLLPRLEGRYDAAIAFQWPHEYMAYKITAAKKFAWVHTDMGVATLDFQYDMATWEVFDGIACVSQGVLEAFREVYPALAGNCFVFENLLSPEALRAKAEEFIPGDMPGPGARILSIGRLCHQKAFDNAILICKRLLELGRDATWYLIGYGTMEQELRALIAREGMQEHFILLGPRENPCPYLKACDLYAQPSRYEGRAVSVAEAMVLGKPVVVTDFPTARAQVNDGVDGAIVPMDIDGAAQGIFDLLQDPAKMNRIAQNAATRDNSGYGQLPGLYERL